MPDHIWRNAEGDADIHFISDHRGNVEVSLDVLEAMLTRLGCRDVSDESRNIYLSDFDRSLDGLARLRAVANG